MRRIIRTDVYRGLPEWIRINCGSLRHRVVKGVAFASEPHGDHVLFIETYCGFFTPTFGHARADHAPCIVCR
jgi:hypothetical protein